MKRVILIHGWQGQPGNHWKGWLRKKLEVQGIAVIEPNMPNNSNQPDDWIKKLAEIVGVPNHETILIRHSLGCPTIIGYLMKLESSEQFAGTILVAGFSSQLDAQGDLHLWDFNPEEVIRAKKHCDSFISIISDNDNSVPIEKSKELNILVDGKIILEHGK